MLQFLGNFFHVFSKLSVVFTNQHKINLSFISTHTICYFPLIFHFKPYAFTTHNSFSLQNSSNLCSTFLLPFQYPSCTSSKPTTWLSSCHLSHPDQEPLHQGFVNRTRMPFLHIIDPSRCLVFLPGAHMHISLT